MPELIQKQINAPALRGGRGDQEVINTQQERQLVCNGQGSQVPL